MEAELPVSEAVRRRALDYLQQHRVMTLATQGPHGIWAAALFYVNYAFTLYFLSAGHTRHARNLAAAPRAAATIQEEYEDWPEIKGIQLEGVVEVLADAAREEAERRYREKYPFLAAADPSIQEALSRMNWYRLTPDRLYFIDNSRGLGHRDEVALFS